MTIWNDELWLQYGSHVGLDLRTYNPCDLPPVEAGRGKVQTVAQTLAAICVDAEQSSPNVQVNAERVDIGQRQGWGAGGVAQTTGAPSLPPRPRPLV